MLETFQLYKSTGKKSRLVENVGLDFNFWVYLVVIAGYNYERQSITILDWILYGRYESRLRDSIMQT